MYLPVPICTSTGSLKGLLPIEFTPATLMLYTLSNTRSFTMIYLSVLVRLYVILLLLMITIYSIILPLRRLQSISSHMILFAVKFPERAIVDFGDPNGTI